jgi:hypothetical protein
MKHMLVVLSNAHEGQDEAFNRWYNDTHLGDVLQVPGYSAAQRFRVSDAQLSEGELPYRFLALYEVEAEDAAEAAKALSSGAGGMIIDPSLDRVHTVAWLYTPITKRVTAASNESAAG